MESMGLFRSVQWAPVYGYHHTKYQKPSIPAQAPVVGVVLMLLRG